MIPKKIPFFGKIGFSQYCCIVCKVLSVNALPRYENPPQDRKSVFKTDAIDHSATPPEVRMTAGFFAASPPVQGKSRK